MAKKGTFPANAMRRGEIYWVDIPNAIGHELMKDRPAIIVSCDALNDNSPVVQVVYCSASPKKELPEHITIRSTEQISTALRENVYTVDKSRVGRYVGRCTSGRWSRWTSASSLAWVWPSTALQAPRRTRRSRSRYAGTPRTARLPWPL